MLPASAAWGEGLITVLVAPFVMIERALLSPATSGISMLKLFTYAVGWELVFRTFRWLVRWLCLGSKSSLMLGNGELPGESVDMLRQELRELNLPKLKSRALKSGVTQATIDHAVDACRGRLIQLHPRLVKTILATQRQRAEARAVDVLIEQGPSYFVSMVHATIVGVRGICHAAFMFGAPTNVKLVMENGSETQWAATLYAIEQTNHLFLSYLLVDLCHVLTSFPRLGGLDMIAHHTVFIICSVVCGSLRALPFPFAWLILGELSTIWLSVRWFLIKTGRGAGRAMYTTNIVFAVKFIVTRVVVYAVGLVQLLRALFCDAALAEEEQVLDTLPHCRLRVLEEEEHEADQFQIGVTKEDTSLIGCERAQQMIYGVVALLLAGQGLNLIWANQIIRMASSKAKRKAGGSKEYMQAVGTTTEPTAALEAARSKEKGA